MTIISNLSLDVGISKQVTKRERGRKRETDREREIEASPLNCAALILNKVHNVWRRFYLQQSA